MVNRQNDLSLPSQNLMSMKEIIRNYQDALDVRNKLAPKQTNGWHFLYRGHASMGFKLLSMIGRKQPIKGDWLDCERKSLNDFKDLVKKENWLQYKIGSYNEEMFYLSIGRHIGLACRLLDWTTKLETALYFAALDKDFKNEDGQLWVMCYPDSIDDRNAKVDPFGINKLTLVKENYWSKDDTPANNQPLGIARRFSQNGFFTITPTDQLTTPLDKIDKGDVHFIPYTIAASAKEDILNHLSGYEEYLHLSTSSTIDEEIKIINSKYFKQL